MGRFDEYMSYFDKYQKQYGSQTTILYQCGMFYEIYGVDNEQEKIGHVAELSELLRTKFTRTNKNKLGNSRANPLMTGFPVASLDNFTKILMDHNYTVIIVDQVGAVIVGGREKQLREVTSIISPATYTESTHTDNYLVCVSITGYTSKALKSGKLHVVGMSSIDLATGKSYVHEACDLIQDNTYSLDEVYRFIQSFQPKEIIISMKDCAEDITEDYVVDYFDLGNILRHIHVNEKHSLAKDTFQNNLLGQIFKNYGTLTPIEYLDLERYREATFSYCLLLEFCQSHNKVLLNHLQRPDVWDGSNQFILDNNAITQLNLVNSMTPSNRKHSSVLSVVCETCTSMGKRLLKERLLNPIRNIHTLQQRYNYIENMYDLTEDLEYTEKQKESMIKTKYETRECRWFTLFEKLLREVVDLERYHRKIETNRLQPSEFGTLDHSYNVISKILSATKNSYFSSLFPDNISTEFENFKKQYHEIIDVHEISKYMLNDITDSFFKRGYNADLDELSDTIRHNNHVLQILGEKLSDTIKKGCNYIVVKKDNDDSHYLQISKTRFKNFKQSFTSLSFTFESKIYNITGIRKFSIDDRTKSSVKLRGSIIDSCSKIIKQSTKKLQELVKQLYIQFLENVTSKWSKMLRYIVKGVSDLDFYMSAAKSAEKNNYCKPIILEGTRSRFNAISLRHPIIEKLGTVTNYVPHNIALGDSEAMDGMLLYGVNSTGKSSTMKAVGIATILAQAGLYVPATKFEFVPYNNIMTRILGNDNLFKGLSSFGVEMSELRGILNRANQNTLVLGDEICHGTETYSAVALVASSVIDLASNQANFIFATHLHQLSDMSEIKELENVKQYHLTVRHDPLTDKLIYNRLLTEGAGEATYGIEVAKAQKIPMKIIHMANTLRDKYFGNVIDPVESNYNKKVIVSTCKVCQKKATETHHILFQSEADNKGYIGHFHKNTQSNLVPLCNDCHTMVHNPGTNRELIIFGYTGHDGKLDYTFRKPLKSLNQKLTLK